LKFRGVFPYRNTQALSAAMLEIISIREIRHIRVIRVKNFPPYQMEAHLLQMSHFHLVLLLIIANIE
jgi:hypothetical protein